MAVPRMPSNIWSSQGKRRIMSHDGNGMWRKKPSLQARFSSMATFRFEIILDEKLDLILWSKNHFKKVQKT